MLTEFLRKIKQPDFHLILSYSVLVIGIGLVIIRQYELLSYTIFGDETETIIVAKMINAGSTLYSEIFNHHGPLVFLPGVILEKLGNFGIKGHRIVIVFLQWLMFAAIYFSPLIRNSLLKNYIVVSSAFYLVVFLPFLYGHLYLYQTLAGIISVIVLVYYVLPEILVPEQISKKNQIVGNILLACLPFLAITYLLLFLFLFLATINKNNIKSNSKYLSIGIFLNIVFLALIGSFKGYIADHFYLNINIMPEFTGNLSILDQSLAIFIFFTSNSLGLLLFLSLCLILIQTSLIGNKWIVIKIIFVLLGLSSLLFRKTTGVHALPFFYAIIFIPVILFTRITVIEQTTKTVLFIIMLFFLTKLSLIFGIDGDKIRANRTPTTSEFSELTKQLTHSNDKIIVYTFSNHEYLFSDRLPASGNFFYFPWQEKYSKNPILGINIDTCDDIKKSKPKLMYLDKWKVWNRISWNSYAKCIDDIATKDYVKINHKPYYIRKDIYNQSNILNDIVASDLSDENWDRGVSKNFPAFIIKNNIESLISLTKGKIIQFKYSGSRKIIDITSTPHFINIYVSGEKLKPLDDGFPHKIKIINQ